MNHRYWLGVLTLTVAALFQGGNANAALQSNQLNNTVSDVLACNGHPWIDVKCNGALGDGSHDDTAALNTTETDAIANNVPMHIPAGTYKVTTKLSWDFAGVAASGLQIISENAAINGTTIGGAGNVLQLFCSGGSVGSPTACAGLRIAGTLTVAGNSTGYVADIGQTDFSDKLTGATIDRLIATNASSNAGAGGVRVNYVSQGSNLTVNGTTAGGAASVAGVTVTQLQNSRLSGHGSTAGASGADLLISGGITRGNTIAGFSYDTAANTCLSVTSTTAANNTVLAPYFGCTTAVNATQNNKGVTLIAPSFSGTNLGPTSQGVSVLGRGGLSRFNNAVTSTYTAAGADDGTIYDSASASGAGITITLPDPAAVGAGWTMGFSTSGGKGLTATVSSHNIVSGNQALTSLVMGPLNYESAQIVSDGTNFRLIQATPATRRANGLDAGAPMGYRWEYPAGPGYAATVADNGQMISADATGSGLTVTLPVRSTLTAGWGVTLDAQTMPLTVVVAAGTLTFPGTTTNVNGTYVFGLGTLQVTYDGTNFRAVQLLGGGGTPTGQRVPISTSTTLSSTQCGSTVALTGSTEFTLTTPSASQVPQGCRIDVLNEVTAPELVNVAGVGNFFIYPGQRAKLHAQNSAWQVDRPLRYALHTTPASPLILYTDAVNGNDNNDGWAPGAGRAMKTAIQCLLRATNDFDFANFPSGNQTVVECLMADSTTDTSNVHFPSPAIPGGQGGAHLILSGGTNSVLSSTGAPAIDVYYGQLAIKNLTLQSDNSCISANRGSQVELIGTIIFNGCTNQDMVALNNGVLINSATVTVAGQVGAHEQATTSGVLEDDTGATIATDLTLSSAGFASAISGGTINVNTNPTFTVSGGHTVTGGKFYTGTGGTIGTGGGVDPNTIFPGTVNGTTNINPASIPIFNLPTVTTKLNLVGTANGVANLDTSGAAAGANPANPTGSSSTSSQVMMGLGADTAGGGADPCVFTPVNSSRVRVTVSGTLSSTLANDGINYSFRVGTGAAPANGAAATGALLQGLNTTYNAVAAVNNQKIPFSATGMALSLTPGVPVWIDMTLGASIGGTASVLTPGCTWAEQ